MSICTVAALDFALTQISVKATQLAVRPEHAAHLPVARFRMKRSLDVVAASLLLILLAPLLLLIWLASIVAGRGPIFYVHRRVGRQGRMFGCLKFRTMRVDADAVLANLLEHDAQARQEWETNRKLKRDPRVTRVGNILRKTSLDELPQLINVLCGDMSLVGPRPVVLAELQKHYRGNARETYCSVRPGITGLWQVNGRSDTDYDRRVAFDCQYVHNLSIRNDFILLARTVKAVVDRDGAR